MAPKTAEPKSKRSSKKGSDDGALLSREQQRDILAVGLLALALFILLSLVPVSWLGSRGFDWFPSGNAMGEVGAVIATLFGAGIGVASVLLPALVVVAGLRAGDWLPVLWG